MLGHYLVDCKKLFQNFAQMVQVKSIGTVGFGLRRIVVDLEKYTVNPCRYGCTGEDGNKFWLPPGYSICGGRCLN